MVYQGSVYLTTAITDDKGELSSLRALRVDAASGVILWDEEGIPVSGKVPRKHAKNGYASPTPIVANDRVYVHFGPMGTACLDTAGKVLWRQTDLAYRTPYGGGGSPVLHDGKLIFSCDAGKETPYIVALDARSGKVVWRRDRITTATNGFSFSTPTLIDDEKRKLVVSAGSGMVGAYDVDDGKEVWRVGYGEGFSVVPRPVVAHGLIFVATGSQHKGRGDGSESVLAIRLGGRGDVTDTHVAWRYTEAKPHVPSMLAVGDELYFVNEMRAELICLDAVTGQLHWRERIRGRFTASPVYANGRIYVTTEKGKSVVVKAPKEYELLAENDLNETALASAALSGPVLFMRTENALYRIEEAGE